MTFAKSVLAVCLLGCAALSPLAVAQEPTVDDIIKKYIEARGGEAKINAVRSMKMTGKVVVGGGQMELPIVAQVKRPNKSHAEISFQGKKIIEGFDGETKWSINPMSGSTDAQKGSEEDTKMARDDSDEIEGPLMNYKAKGHKVELLGKEDVEGSPAYKLKLDLKSGNSATFFIDAQNYMVIKTVAKRKMMGQEMEMESYPSNYKTVDGIVLPFSIENKTGGRSMMQMQFEKVEMNQPVDDTLFAMPKPEPKKEEAPAEKKQ